MMKTRVLVVDDSALARDMVRAALSRADDIEVIGMAADPLLARRQIALLHPDVLTLDVEMPRMDGLAFLDQIMRLRPMPVVMVSSLTSQGSGVSLKALALGAVDVVVKPVSSGVAFDSLSEELVEKVRLAGIARVHASQRAGRPTPYFGADSKTLVAAVGGAGSVQAVGDLLHGWPGDGPPLLLMPAVGGFDPVDLAAVLGKATAARVCGAEPGLTIEAGQVVVFAPTQGLTICAKENGGYAVAPLQQGKMTKTGSSVSPEMPNMVDLFLSEVAHLAASHAVAVALTSAERNGLQGLAAVAEAGGTVLVQDRASSMFQGLADAVLAQGPGQGIPARIVALPRLAREILAACR
jgi:two-component system chemotaxis response regulator CheB